MVQVLLYVAKCFQAEVTQLLFVPLGSIIITMWLMIDDRIQTEHHLKVVCTIQSME